MTTLVASRLTWAPWTDKKGRFDPLRTTVLALLVLPGLWTGARMALHLLGAEPVNTAIHSTGYWAVIFLVASLVVRPAKALLGLPNLIVVRRMVGNAALAYAAIHLVLYCVDQNWRPLTIVREIVLRFYLTIGFVTFCGLAVLGATSTDSAIRRMGPSWKRLHRLTYVLTALALVHFILQTKADVSVPLLFVGLFYFLMLWRRLPAGPDRLPIPIALLALVSAGLTAATEWLWYRFGTHIDPNKILRDELDVSYGLHPAGQLLILGLLALAALRLYRVSLGRVGQAALFWIVLFACGAALAELLVYVFGIDRLLDPDDYSYLYQDAAWAGLLAILGYVRWRCRDSAYRHAVDLLGLACVAFQLLLADDGLQGAGIAVASAIALFWAVLAWCTWPRTKATAAAWIPASLVLAYGVNSLM